MHYNTPIRKRLIEAQARLAILREAGVFWIVPQIEDDWSYPNAKRLVFRVRVNGERQRIIDEKARKIRHTSLPLIRNKRKSNLLLEKVERTKEAEELIEEIEQLQKQLQKIEQKEIEQAKRRQLQLSFA